MNAYRSENAGRHEEVISGIVAYKVSRGEYLPPHLLKKAIEEARRIDEQRPNLTPTGVINGQLRAYNYLIRKD
jgi:hypothetical protein